MRKHSYFASRFREGWPELAEMEPYFLAPAGKRWFFETRNDSAGLTVEGVDGADHFGPIDQRRIVIHLDMWGHPELGVQLTYSKRGGGHDETFYSMGDLARLDEHVPSLHDTLLPVGLFIPCALDTGCSVVAPIRKCHPVPSAASTPRSSSGGLRNCRTSTDHHAARGYEKSER